MKSLKKISKYSSEIVSWFPFFIFLYISLDISLDSLRNSCKSKTVSGSTSNFPSDISAIPQRFFWGSSSLNSSVFFCRLFTKIHKELHFYECIYGIMTKPSKHKELLFKLIQQRTCWENYRQPPSMRQTPLRILLSFLPCSS